MFLVVWQDGEAVKVEVCDTEASAYDMAEDLSKKSGRTSYVAELLAEMSPTS